MATVQNEASRLEALLRQQQAAAQPAAHPGPDAQRMVGEWLEDLDRLLNQFDTWLAGIEPGLLKVHRLKVEVDEGSLPTYAAPARSFESPAGRVVRVIPYGRLIANATGRVDLLAPPLRAMLVRFAAEDWRFVTSESSGTEVTTRALSQESFLGVLRELLR